MAEKPRIPRKDRSGASPAVVGLVLVVLIAIGTYLGFTKDIPFTKGFRVQAVFDSANSIRANSPVRVAGVEVGKVKAIKRYQDTDLSVVELEIKDKGLPIHKDARLKIRPRIFLEGNFFVDMEPGTPGSPTISDGDTIRVTQTSAPVQLDELLTALQTDTREDLKTVLDEFGRALDGPPRASDRLAGEFPNEAAEGQTAGESLNDTYDDAGPALRGLAIVNEAFLGEEPRDVSRLIAGLQRVTSALGRNEALLQDWLVNFNRTMSIFADEKANVSATIRQLPQTLSNADQAFASLNRAFPPTRAFAREILPGVRETAPTIDASRPWISQTRQLLSPNELQGLARDLQPAARDLAAAADAGIRFFPQQNLFAKCLDRVILPTGDIRIRETGARAGFDTGVENYKEFWYTMAGLAGESQNFDGNGQMVRFQTGGGTNTLTTGPANSNGQTQFFNLAANPIGTRPVFPGKRPPYRPDVACHTQQIPDLNSARVGQPDGGQGPAAGGPSGGAGAGGTGGPVPALPQLPALPVPAPTGAAGPVTGLLPAARAARSGRSSLAGELAGRLNPFRATQQRRAQRAGRRAARRGGTR
jgi:phospholipid/cholesterol/gamma-HCH transport system substrate-binding protein